MEKQFHSVLIVDDDPITTYLHSKLLEKEKVAENIIVKSKVRDSLHYLKFENDNGILPELIILDIDMPEMDGYDFLNAISKMSLNSKPSIVVVTNSPLNRNTQKLSKYNIAYYSEKPFTRESLGEALSILKLHQNN